MKNTNLTQSIVHYNFNSFFLILHIYQKITLKKYNIMSINIFNLFKKYFVKKILT